MWNALLLFLGFLALAIATPMLARIALGADRNIITALVVYATLEALGLTLLIGLFT